MVEALAGLLTIVMMLGCATNSSAIIKGSIRDDGKTRVVGVCDKPSVSIPIFKNKGYDEEYDDEI